MKEDPESLGDLIQDGLKKYYRMVMIDNIEKGRENPSTLSTEEFEVVFGPVEYEDFYILNKLALKEIGKIEKLNDRSKYDLLMRWGGDWFRFLLKKNEEIEHYENCITYYNLIKTLEKDYVVI
jgi:hypothetical protein